MYRERPSKPQYPRLNETQDRRVKLTTEDKGHITKLFFEWGVSRTDLADAYSVSYHSIYWLTCNEETRRKYEEQLTRQSKKQWEKAKRDKTLKDKLQSSQRKSRNWRRVSNPEFKEWERVTWLSKHPPSAPPVDNGASQNPQV